MGMLSQRSLDSRVQRSSCFVFFNVVVAIVSGHCGRHVVRSMMMVETIPTIAMLPQFYHTIIDEFEEIIVPAEGKIYNHLMQRAMVAAMCMKSVAAFRHVMFGSGENHHISGNAITQKFAWRSSNGTSPAEASWGEYATII